MFFTTISLGVQTCSSQRFRWASRHVLHNDFVGRPDMFFTTISLGFARFFLRACLNVSPDVLDCPDPFCVHKQLSSLTFCVMHVQSALLLATVLTPPSQMNTAQSCSTVIFHTPTHKIQLKHIRLFSSSEGHLYTCESKNIKH